MSEARKIAAILVADVVGYSRLVGVDEDRTLSRLRGLRSDLIDPAIAAHHGRIVKRTGDGSLVEFRSVVAAVRCAIELQNGLVERNEGLPPERRVEFRVGIHLGDVVEEADGDLMGDGVNIAARLESICETGAVCLSEDAYRLSGDPAQRAYQAPGCDRFGHARLGPGVAGDPATDAPEAEHLPRGAKLVRPGAKIDPDDADALAGDALTYVVQNVFFPSNVATDYEAKIFGQADRAIALAAQTEEG